MYGSLKFVMRPARLWYSSAPVTKDKYKI